MMRKTIIASLVILAGGIALGWTSYELGAKSRMVDCLVAELGVRVKENLETLSLLEKQDIEGAKSASKERLRNSAELLFGYRRKICAETNEVACKKLEEIGEALLTNNY